MVKKILNNTTPYGKFRASHEGSLHSSTLKQFDTTLPFDIYSDFGYKKYYHQLKNNKCIS